LTRRLFVFLAIAIILLFGALGAISGFRALGAWLIREDTLVPADAIVVSGGSLPAVAERAAQLFRMGYGREVWVSRGEESGDELAKIGIHYVAEEEYDREILVHEGVPEAAVHIFPDIFHSADQEVQEAARQMVREHVTSVIIVTSPQHTRCVRTVWDTTVGRNPRLIVRAAWERPFDSRRWWSNTRDTFSVVQELAALLTIWTGHPFKIRFSWFW